jgi:hypothetical protein
MTTLERIIADQFVNALEVSGPAKFASRTNPVNPNSEKRRYS